MHRVPAPVIVFGQFLDLGVAVVAGRDHIIRLGGHDLTDLGLPVGQPRILVSRLQKSAATAAAIIVGAVGEHVHEILLAHAGLDHETQGVGKGIAMDLRTAMHGSWTVKRSPRSLFHSGLGRSLPSRIHLAYQLTIWSNSTPASIVESLQPGPDGIKGVAAFDIDP